MGRMEGEGGSRGRWVVDVEGEFVSVLKGSMRREKVADEERLRF